MSDHQFGYYPELPEAIRDIFAHLCRDVAWLHADWRLYRELFHSRESTEALNAVAPGAFQVIEESLRVAMTMAVCRLTDPAQSCGFDNLSLRTLVGCVGADPTLTALLERLDDVSAPIQLFRNKQVGHNDLNTALRPKDTPLPGIGSQQIDTVLELAGSILNAVGQQFIAQTWGFDLRLIGGGEALVHAMQTVQRQRGEEYRRLTGSDPSFLNRPRK